MAEVASRALKKCWKLIVESVPDANVESLNIFLWTEEIYNDTVREAIDAKRTTREKMNEMLRVLWKKVRQDATALDKFMEALRESEFEELADELKSTRNELEKASVRKPSPGRAGKNRGPGTSREEECSSDDGESTQEKPESTDDGSDDDNDVQEVAEQPRKRSRGTCQDGKKRVKLDHSEFDGGTRSAKTGKGKHQSSTKSNGNKHKQMTRGGAIASSESGSNSKRNGSSGSLNVLDLEPTQEDLRMLVAGEVADYTSLGTMLGIKSVKIEMFQGELKKTLLINMKILTTWIDSETKEPITWRTLLQALRDMEENALASKITRTLQERACAV